MNVIEFNNVSKKFRKGEKFNSLRDFIPNLVKSLLPFAGKEKEYLGEKEFWALRDVSFNVKKGEIVGVIGPNGAGKSTILKLLSRIMDPNIGKIRIMGRLSALIEVTAGFHPDLTGRENVYLNGTILGMSKKEIDNKFDEIVEFSGIKEFIDTPVKRYSSGMYSRLGFSVAAHMEPDILLVDEVLAVGDIAFQAKCAQKIRELLKSNTTIILVSHSLSLIKSLCKRVILLNRGEILKEGSPEEVIPYYQNIVYKESEEEFKRSASFDYKVKIDRELPVEISNVYLYDAKYNQKESFNIYEPISIKVEYKAKEKIESPIFFLGIIRSDGVVCCSLNTKKDGFLIDSIQNEGVLKIDLRDINLAPGVYILEIYILDKDMIHPYVYRKKDILRIEASEADEHTDTVVLLKANWEISNFSQ